MYTTRILPYPEDTPGSRLAADRGRVIGQGDDMTLNLHEELIEQIVHIANNDASDHLQISMRHLLAQVANVTRQPAVTPAAHEVRADFLQSVAIQASGRLEGRTVVYEELAPHDAFWQHGPKGRRTVVPAQPSQQRFHVRYAA